MSETTYDVVFIGGGPGGYTGAIRAAQLGLRTACVERRGALGGTCLNIGCIPSKALLESSHHFAMVQHDLADHGIRIGSAELDLAAMMARKDKVVDGLTKGIAMLFRKNKVDHVAGQARIVDAGTVEVTAGDGSTQRLKAANLVVATGSESMDLPGVAVDGRRIVSSTGALELAEVPKHLVVVGGGYIGLEMGSVWRRLGAEVTVVEFLDRITPTMDAELAKHLQRALTKQGMKFRLKTKVAGAEAGDDGVALTLEPADGGEAETLRADVVLVSIGRRPVTDGLGLAEAGVELTNRGFVPVDEDFQTNVTGIFAIGDVIPDRPMLAHKAEEEGVAVAELIAGKPGHVNYAVIPAVIFTHPEVATVGRNEEELKRDGVDYAVGKFPFTANSRARANADAEGFVKILADGKTDRVLGCHIIGPDAGTMIAEMAAFMEFGASAEDVARTCHAHPTLNEAVREAALAVAGRTLNM